MIRSKMIQVVKIALTFAVVLYIAFWGFNKLKLINMKTYEWEPTSNAPILFPADIHVAYMSYGENRALMFLANEFTNLKKEIPYEIMHCLSLGHTFPEYIQSSTINHIDYHPCYSAK